MAILEVSGLRKVYPAFTLEDISFALEPGKITGFIGRNGAGKSTTLKSLLGLVHPDGGAVRFFGADFAADEAACKQRLGFVSGGIDYYAKKRLRTITAVTRTFYNTWDEAAYRDCLARFALDESKTPDQLSAGMRVKYALTLALSHRAELLLLDEPTSGLDPVSREDLLEDFLDLCRRGVTILFSTHITSDLDKCADNILYIQKGRLLADAPLEDFLAQYRAVELAQAELTEARRALLIGCREGRRGVTALVRAQDAPALGAPTQAATLEAVMVHLEKEAQA